MSNNVPEFQIFAAQVDHNFRALTKNENKEVYTANISGDALWDAYLKAYPEGTNPIYLKNPQFECSTCRNFVRNVGPLIAVVNNKWTTVWGYSYDKLPYPYNVVAETLHKLVLESGLNTIFRTSEQQYGAESTQHISNGTARKIWHHFWAKIPRHLFAGKYRDTAIGQFNNSIHLFRRSLTTLSLEDIDQVLDLIGNNGLYRGEEHLATLRAFRQLKVTAGSLLTTGGEAELSRFIFKTVVNAHISPTVLGIRNTVIGSLLVDLADGRPFDSSVLAFEQKVAPTNYRRPTALITPRMVEDAQKKIEELGLTNALSRRLANLADVSVNDVLWTSGPARSRMKDNVVSALLNDLKAATTAKKAIQGEVRQTEIGISDFVATVLPKTVSLKVLVQRQHLRSLVTLTTTNEKPVDGAGQLFKWSNGFGWSYSGNMTDTIKERVKAAGGNVSAALRVSLSWYNFDDLDLHMHSTKHGHVYFRNKLGILDVDMNAGYGHSKTPVENMAIPKLSDGVYEFFVNQFYLRETTDVGFAIEVALGDSVLGQWRYDKAVQQKDTVPIVNVEVRNNIVDVKVSDKLTPGDKPVVQWGITTEQFVPVQTIMQSPNYWTCESRPAGNRHWFFFLEGCKTEEPVRGFYNEFLLPTLDQHRKVFEVLGNRVMCPPTPDQLSGLGFSSTQENLIVVSAELTDGTNRLYRLRFGDTKDTDPNAMTVNKAPPIVTTGEQSPVIRQVQLEQETVA